MSIRQSSLHPGSEKRFYYTDHPSPALWKVFLFMDEYDTPVQAAYMYHYYTDERN